MELRAAFLWVEGIIREILRSFLVLQYSDRMVVEDRKILFSRTCTES